MVKIGYEGIQGSHSEDALQQLLETQPAFQQKNAVTEGFSTFEDLLTKVVGGELDLALVPIENSIAGSFFGVVDLILSKNLSIVGEYEHSEIQVLAALSGTKLEALQEVHSHPYAFDQCRPFLATALKDKKLVQSMDTAGSCALISKRKDGNVGAIASSRAASLYGLEVLSEIASEQSVTRYVLVAKDPIIPERHTNPRTSIQIVLKNQVGAIMKAVTVFAHRDISISKIESRPSSRSIKLQKAWEYVIFIDLECGINDPRMQKSLDNLAEFASVRILGSYPRYQKPAEPSAFSYGV